MNVNFVTRIREICQTQTEKINAKTLICEANTEASKIWIQLTGHTMVFSNTEEGQKTCLLILGPYSALPLIWGFDHPEKTAYSYETLTESEFLTIELAEFKNALNTDIELTRESQIGFVYLTWDLMERVKCLQMPNTYEMLTRALPYLAAKAGDKIEPTKYRLKSFVTQDLIAQMLGTSREWISRHFKSLKREGLIMDEKGQAKTIDLEKIPSNFIYSRWFIDKDHENEC